MPDAGATHGTAGLAAGRNGARRAAVWERVLFWAGYGARSSFLRAGRAEVLSGVRFPLVVEAIKSRFSVVYRDSLVPVETTCRIKKSQPKPTYVATFQRGGSPIQVRKQNFCAS